MTVQSGSFIAVMRVNSTYLHIHIEKAINIEVQWQPMLH